MLGAFNTELLLRLWMSITCRAWTTWLRAIKSIPGGFTYALAHVTNPIGPAAIAITDIGRKFPNTFDHDWVELREEGLLLTVFTAQSADCYQVETAGEIPDAYAINCLRWGHFLRQDAAEL